MLKLVLQTLKRAGFSISIVSAGLVYQYIKLKHLTSLSTKQILSRMDVLEGRLIRHYDVKTEEIQNFVSNENQKLNDKFEERFGVLQKQNSELIQIVKRNESKLHKITDILLEDNYSIESINSELTSCLNIENPTEASIKALHTFAKLKKTNEKIENSTIQILIKIFHETHFYEQIYETYEYIRASEFELFEEETLCQLIVGCAKSNRFQEIDDILTRMKEENFEFNLNIYNCLLKCYTKKYDIIKSLKFYKEMKEKDIEPNSETLEYLLETFLNKKDGRFEKVFQGFLKENIELNQNCLNIYFKCLTLLTNDVEKSFNFANKYNLWNKETYMLILKSCAIQKDKHKALCIFDKIIEEEEIEIDVDIFNSFIESFSNDGDYMIFKLFQNFNGEPDINTFNLLLKPTCMNNDLKKAKQIYDEIRSRGLEPNVVTHNMFLSPLFHQKWKPHIESLMNKEK
eukprot:gene7475-11799_t